ncbi:uncharacterized protein LOC101457561 [Ceratitis capitata]|uniref:uncharacterized protein LOC101457561 n=1 Tax=Ceratitis capitata TaxID=7213 RepID=UPI00032A2CC1|nr:uncharacterized protein LOC101457561 [Ceratitis capitata]
MKFLLLAIFVCCALFLAVNAVPVEEAIPEGIEGVAHDTVEATDDKSVLLKLALLKKLLFLG